MLLVLLWYDNKWTDGWNRWMDGWMDGWMMDGSLSTCDLVQIGYNYSGHCWLHTSNVNHTFCNDIIIAS